MPPVAIASTKKTYSNLHDISSNQIEVLQSTKYGAKLASGPATRLRGTGGGSDFAPRSADIHSNVSSILSLTSRVESVDIQRKVDGVLCADTVNDLLDDAIRANLVNLASLHNLEATVSIVLVVTGSAERRADTSVDVGVVAQQTLLSGMIEVGAVVDAGNFRRRTAKDLGAPCKM